MDLSIEYHLNISESEFEMILDPVLNYESKIMTKR